VKSYWWEEPSSQTESIEKADDISAEVDNFKEVSENHVEVCNVLRVKTEPSEFEALPLQTHHHVQFQLFQHHNPRLHPQILP
jgi:hypothetical protein